MSTELVTQDNPALNLSIAKEIAGLCKEIVVKCSINIAGKRYVKCEGYLAIAITFGCIASVTSVERIEGGIRAIGVLRKISDGTIIATAEGFVGDDEPMWFKRPEYARRCMSQTRALSRVCRSAFAQIILLMDAGLCTTPAEEADRSQEPATKPEDESQEPQPEAPKPERKKRQYPLRKPKQEAPRQDPADWKNFIVPVGSHKGSSIGGLAKSNLKYYQDNFKPQQFGGAYNPLHVAFREALDYSLGRHPVDPQAEENDEIPA